MLKHFCAALCLCLLPFAALGEEVLDLSQFEDAPEAAEWEERAWYQREDGSDWRLLDDGSVIVTLSATGDVTIGGDTRKSGKSIFDKQLAKEELGLDFPLSNVRSIFESDDLTLVNFEGTLTNTKSATKNTYSFAAPPEYVQVLTSAGVEAVSLENNHVMDHGDAGYRDTCQTLSDAGIVYSGHLGASAYTTDTGVKIGMLAYQISSRFAMQDAASLSFPIIGARKRITSPMSVRFRSDAQPSTRARIWSSGITATA